MPSIACMLAQEHNLCDSRENITSKWFPRVHYFTHLNRR